MAIVARRCTGPSVGPLVSFHWKTKKAFTANPISTIATTPNRRYLRLTFMPSRCLRSCLHKDCLRSPFLVNIDVIYTYERLRRSALGAEHANASVSLSEKTMDQ